VDRLELRAKVKQVLQKQFGLAEDPDVPILAWVGRLVQQKGIDLVIELLPRLMSMNLQLLVLGSGESRYQSALNRWASLYPDRISIKLGYDEPSAHLLEGGCDIFLMPSRFEPCGLNQMYSQRYGAVPLVRRVGGLADTVEDANPRNIEAGTATGVLFNRARADSLFAAINRAINLYQDRDLWRKIQITGMLKDFTWRTSAQRYVELYRLAVGDCENAGSFFRANVQ
jgi:starch synthase